MDYHDLRSHIGHTIAVVAYGGNERGPHNVAIECEDCSAVLLDFDQPSELDDLRAERARLWAQFEKDGMRGVDTAERIDRLDATIERMERD